ncbi:MAG: Gfo/Idh/MocA family oxidoreductase [Ignavibacteriae bacterium]|nr:Gfo/Idh/MocA family oxidoreductase [Ignavibacteriota bacterium]MCB9215883.1 Gfo/Idh/MocA family oxidoreductase [Ignavibacteria bacterium]
MSDIRLGVVGAGKLGAIHVRLAKETPNAEFVGLYDLDAERAAHVAGEYGTKAFNSVAELIDSVDACCIVTPTTTHHQIALQCLEAGVHAFIEKPIAATVEEAEEISRLAEDRGLVLQVGHVERFNPAFLTLGESRPDPLFIEAHRLAQFSPRASDVAVVLDLMIHDIDLVLALNRGEEPTEIRASGVAVVSDEIDIANARLEFANGCTANLTASRISRNPMRKMRLFARDSYISLDFAAPSLEFFSISDQGSEGAQDGSLMLGAIEQGSRVRSVRYGKPEVKGINAIAEELRLFVETIRMGGLAAVTAREGTSALRVATMILEDIARSQPKIDVA